VSAVAAPVPAATVPRRRILIALVLAAVGVALLLGLLRLGGSDRVGPLDWSGQPVLFTHPTLPGDRLLTATLRNDGLRPLRVDIADVRLVDSAGRCCGRAG
jgi:hypothetical protein